MGELRTWPDEHGVILAGAGNLLVNMLTGRPVNEGLDRTVAVSDVFLATYPAGFINVTVVPKGTPMPDASYLRYSGETVKRRGGTTLMNVLAVEGDGFWAAAVRATLVSIERLSGDHLEVVASLDAALEAGRDVFAGGDFDAAKASLLAWRQAWPGATS